MDLGIFDHLDRREGVPLDEFYESRLSCSRSTMPRALPRTTWPSTT